MTCSRRRFTLPASGNGRGWSCPCTAQPDNHGHPGGVPRVDIHPGPEFVPSGSSAHRSKWPFLAAWRPGWLFGDCLGEGLAQASCQRAETSCTTAGARLEGLSGEARRRAEARRSARSNACHRPGDHAEKACLQKSFAARMQRKKPAWFRSGTQRCLKLTMNYRFINHYNLPWKTSSRERGPPAR